MDKVVYLHIGTPKTGSSAIQFFCGNNRKLLKEKGVAYPKMPFAFEGIGQYRNAHFLSHKVYKDDKRDYAAQGEIYQEGMKVIQESLQQADKVVLSDEHLWNETEWDEERFQMLRMQMEKMGATLKVIVYLRRQDLLVQSYWAQQVKEGLQLSFLEYLEQRRYAYFQMHYAKRLSRIEKAVGLENLIVRVYEKEQYAGEERTILSDFMDILSINDLSDFSQDEPIRNTSLSGIYLEYKRRMNQYPIYRTKKNFLVVILTRLQEKEQGKQFYDQAVWFDWESHQKFMSQFEEENSFVAVRYLHRESGRLFLADASFEQKEKTEYSDRELFELCGRVLAEHEESRVEKIHMIQELRKKECEYKKDIQYLRETQSLLKRIRRKCKLVLKEWITHSGSEENENITEKSTTQMG